MGPCHPLEALRRNGHGTPISYRFPSLTITADALPPTQAIRAFLALLSLLPHDPGVLRELAPLLAQTEQYQQATTLLLSAFAYYRQLVPLVTPFNVDLLQTYGYGDLETLADFLLLQRNWNEVVRVIRQGVRWLQGREKETGWDAMEDDREYDEERKVRDGWEKGNTYFEEEPTYELDVRLRSRLGLARLGMDWVPEAQVRLHSPFLSSYVACLIRAA